MHQTSISQTSAKSQKPKQQKGNKLEELLGLSADKQAEMEQKITTVAAGTVYTWGACTPSLGRSVAYREDAVKPVELFSIEDSVVQIAAGKDHVLALTHKGTVFGWGSNKYGQLAMDPKEIIDMKTPEIIIKDKDMKMQQIIAGKYYSIANKDNTLRDLNNPIIFSPIPVSLEFYRSGEIALPSGDEAEPYYILKPDTRITTSGLGTYFYEVHKTDKNPKEQILERQLSEVQRQFYQAKEKLDSKNAKDENKDVRRKEEKELEAHACDEIKRLVEKTEKVDKKKATAIAEKQVLKEERRLLMQKLNNLTQKTKGKADWEKGAIDSTINQNEVMLSEKKKALILKKTEIKALEKKQELLENWKNLHENFLKTLTKSTSRDYLANRQTDMEHLLDALYLHHKHVQNSSLFDRKHSQSPNQGIKKMLEKSNVDLEKLEKLPPALNLSEADPRKNVFSIIWKIIKDNISLKKILNNSVDALVEQSRRKLEEVVKMEDTPLKDAAKTLKQKYLVAWGQKADLPKVENLEEKQQKMIENTKEKIMKSKERENADPWEKIRKKAAGKNNTSSIQEEDSDEEADKIEAFSRNSSEFP